MMMLGLVFNGEILLVITEYYKISIHFVAAGEGSRGKLGTGWNSETTT
jgi:hypothetical protein